MYFPIAWNDESINGGTHPYKDIICSIMLSRDIYSFLVNSNNGNCRVQNAKVVHKIKGPKAMVELGRLWRQHLCTRMHGLNLFNFFLVKIIQYDSYIGKWTLDKNGKNTLKTEQKIMHRKMNLEVDKSNTSFENRIWKRYYHQQTD